MEEGEFEVDRIVDVRSGKKTRFGRVYRRNLVYWKGYNDPLWVAEVDFDCDALLQEFDRDRKSRNRFEVMQSHEKEIDG